MKNSPTIILVRPQMAENIGAAARVMDNFGLADLRLVAPRDGWPQPLAGKMATSAEHLVEKAKLFRTVEEAVADLNYVIATTSRSRDMQKPVTSLRTLFKAKKAKLRGKTGILFGPERTGLTNDDLILADSLMTIDINPKNPSLNLAQAVAVVAYEWSLLKPAKKAKNTIEMANKSDIEGMLKHLEKELLKSDFLHNAKMRPKMLMNIKNIFTRAELTDQEVRTLRGVIRALSESKDE